MFKPVTVVVALCWLLVGCSGLKSYRSDHQANLFITTDTEERGWLSNVDAEVDIYQMRDDCDIDYQGTVDLGDSLVEVGVPPGVAAYLVFRVESSVFLTNTYSSVGYDLAFYPDFGQVYDVNVVYRDNIYDVEVQERPRGSSERQRLLLGSARQDCGNNILKRSRATTALNSRFKRHSHSIGFPNAARIGLYLRANLEAK